jgi:hypothetical protein
MKNFVAICGTKSKNYEFRDWMKDCDVLRVSEKEVVNDCEDEKFFSYKCLEYANHEKNKLELNSLKLYDICFFVDSNNIELPDKIINPHRQEVVVINPKIEIYRKRSYQKKIILEVSSSFWYCKSVEFNSVSKFYKGKHAQNTDSRLPSFELSFYNYIRKLGFNFIYEE